jgi:hypothetical protein
VRRHEKMTLKNIDTKTQDAEVKVSANGNGVKLPRVLSCYFPLALNLKGSDFKTVLPRV